MRHARCYEEGFWQNQEMISIDQLQTVVQKVLTLGRLFSDRRECVLYAIPPEASCCCRGGCLLMAQLNSCR